MTYERFGKTHAIFDRAIAIALRRRVSGAIGSGACRLLYGGLIMLFFALLSSCSNPFDSGGGGTNNGGGVSETPPRVVGISTSEPDVVDIEDGLEGSHDVEVKWTGGDDPVTISLMLEDHGTLDHEVFYRANEEACSDLPSSFTLSEVSGTIEIDEDDVTDTICFYSSYNTDKGKDAQSGSTIEHPLRVKFIIEEKGFE